MSAQGQSIARTIREYRDRLSIEVVETMFSRAPHLKNKYQSLFERLVVDVQFHFDYLSESIHYSSVKLIEDYSKWLLVFFKDINVPLEEIEITFKLIQEKLGEQFDRESQDIIDKYFDILYKNLALKQDYQISSFIETDNPFKDLASRYFVLLINHQRTDAVNLLKEALNNGMSIKDVYMYVFQRTQWEIGRLWQTNKLTVAEEHIFTAATQLIMSQLYPYLFGETDFKGKVIAACVGRELHEVGLRMVADFLEMDGWNTIYVGANTPTRTLLETISKEHPDIIALSITIIPHLKNLRDVIKHIRDNRNFNHIKIIVGGYPFIQENRLWKQVNADGSAINAEEAVKLANQFFE